MRYIGPGGLIVTAISIASFANSLTGMLRRPVVDNTGLQGFFDIRLEFDAESTLRGGPPLGTDPVGPPIFTAIPDQSGLRLESTKGPVAFLLIDSVQKPTETNEATTGGNMTVWACQFGSYWVACCKGLATIVAEHSVLRIEVFSKGV
jgi:hypothetical protein